MVGFFIRKWFWISYRGDSLVGKSIFSLFWIIKYIVGYIMFKGEIYFWDCIIFIFKKDICILFWDY